MTTPLALEQSLRALWGATELPFCENHTGRWLTADLERVEQTLDRYVGLKVSGLLSGPNGVGKTWLLDHFLQRLPDTLFVALRLSHSTLTGADFIRRLCRLNGVAPALRRADNLHQLLEFWQRDGRTPLLAVDEAQNLTPAALEELRLLNCERTRQRGRDTTPPFVLLLCGNDDLPPLLDLNTQAALRSRLSFQLRLAPWTADLTAAYCAAQWQQVGVNVNPMDPQALGLLHMAAEGIPRTINQIALNALLNALDQRQKTITSQHVQTALDALPWIGKNMF
jgi:general secretion pathway protein A